MPITLYAHLPGIILDEDDLPFADGRISRLPFEEWLVLDGGMFEYMDRKYTKAAPVFWIKQLAEEDMLGEGGVPQASNKAIWLMHSALLLEPRVPLLPTPVLSSSYITISSPQRTADLTEGLAQTMRLIGPMEREWIVFGSPLSYRFGASELAHVDVLYRLLNRAGTYDVEHEIAAGFSVLEETARPDSWYGGDAEINRQYDFVLCIAACENILLPAEDQLQKEGLTETFGRHAATLLAPSPGFKMEMARRFSSLYRLRSELMHGRSIQAQLDSASKTSLHDGRVLLGNILIAALKIRIAMPDVPDLPSLLAECEGDLDRQAALASALGKGVGL